MRPTSRYNDHIRSDDGQTHRHTPIPLIDSGGMGRVKSVGTLQCEEKNNLADEKVLALQRDEAVRKSADGSRRPLQETSVP